MKLNPMVLIVVGILLGMAGTALLDHVEVDEPCAKAIAAANASVESARKTVADARAEQEAAQSGFTIIEEIDYAPAPVASTGNNAAMALGILGAITGRNLSGLASVLPQPPTQTLQPTGWHGFMIRGHVQPLAGGPTGTQAFYSFCVTDKNCTSPAVIPPVTQADLTAARP